MLLLQSAWTDKTQKHNNNAQIKTTPATVSIDLHTLHGMQHSDMIHNGSKETLDARTSRRMPQGYNEQTILTSLCILFLLHQTAEINMLYICKTSILLYAHNCNHNALQI